MACTLRDIFRDYAEVNDDITLLAQHVAIQLNDTHPALAVVELMRIWSMNTDCHGSRRGR